MENKNPLQSRTIWVNAIMAVSAFFPQVQHALESNPTILVIGFSLINIALRLITKKEITIS